MKSCTSPAILLMALLLGACSSSAPELPNILWITSEDNSRLLGCYGDDFATTPHLDQLASEGFRYTHAYANTPVCAPARNTILTGVYACANGNEQMRSRYPKSDLVRPYPEFLRELGYYCTNNSKTDYNYQDPDLDAIWDECSKEAHYKNRGDGQPFFAIFNVTISHESCIHKSIPDSLLRHRPEEAPIPPYHPATREMKHDWAQYYDKVEDMDARMGEILAELDEAGLAENTIVFYYSDHGGVLGRSKRFLYETGTHVPMIIRIPEKYKKLFPAAGPGSEVERMVSFVDLAPTLLSIVGMDAPDYMQGSAFLGEHLDPEPAQVYMFRDRMDGRYDMSRSIVNKQYRYTRNFNSNRIYGQHLEYLWRAPSMRSWEEAYLAGQCSDVQSIFWEPKAAEELYDIRKDPWEVNNLAGDPEFEEVLTQMRTAAMEHSREILDAGYMPEAQRVDRTGGTPAYDYMRSGTLPFDQVLEVAWMASLADPAHLDELIALLDHPDETIRYWAMQGLLLLGDQVGPQLERMEAMASDPSLNVAVVAAEILYLQGKKGTALRTYERVLSSEQYMARTHALNSIESIDGPPEEFLEMVKGIENFYQEPAREYDYRVMGTILKKWGMDPAS